MNKPFFDFAGASPSQGGQQPGKETAETADSPHARMPRPAGEHSLAAKADAPAAGAARRAAGTASNNRATPGKDGAGNGEAGNGGARNASRAGGQAGSHAATTRAGGANHMLMIGIFTLSALIGGGVAGLFLAMQDTPGPATQHAAGGSSISIITPTPGQPQASARQASAPATPATPATGKDEERIAATPPASAPSAPSAETASPADAAPRPTATAASTAGAEELQQLTEQVVSALGALGRAEQQGTAEDTAAGTDKLRASLTDLVNAALARGKTNAEIRQLVAEALDNAGEVPALLRDASGKVDVQRLLASVLPTMRADAVPMNRDERTYFNQLAAEAGTTTTDERPSRRAATTASTRRADTRRADVRRADARRNKAGRRAAGRNKARPASRFFVRNGKRYTVIRKGDTLSDIAFAAYGDVLAYSAILRANRGRISVRALKPGTRILIPDTRATSNRKARKRKVRRQGAADNGTAAPRRALAARKAPRAVGTVAPLPTSGAPSARQEAPAKITNFTLARQRKPIPLVNGKTAPTASGQ